jgi:hypothetical protein
MPGGGATVRRLEGRVPPGLGGGRYFLVAVADPEGRVPEVGRGDLWAATPLHVTESAALVGVGPLLVSPEAAFPGERVALAGVLRNEGNVPLPDATVVVRLVSPSRGGSESEAVLFRAARGAVRPGETREVRLTVAVPAGLRRGRHRVVLRVSAPGWGPADLLEGALDVRSKAPGVDLVAFAVRVVPGRARAGERVRVLVSVANLGDGRSPPARLVVREGEGAPSPRGPRGEAELPALAPGETVEVAVPVRLPRDLGEGTTWLVATIDPERRVPQAERENDVAWAPVEVRGRHDRDVALGLDDLEVGDAGEGRPTPGRPFDVRARVHNRGRGRVEDAEVEAVLVGPGGAVRSLGRRPLGGAVPEGDGLDWAERFVLPSDLAPGTYALRLLLDPDARLPWEGDEAGAVAEVPFSVAPSAAAPGPDLAALALDRAAGSAPGSRRLAFTARVGNAGGRPAGAFEASLELEPEAAGAGAWRLPLATALVSAGLRPGAETVVRLDGDAPEFLADGAYRATLVVDPRGEVDRGRLDDNCVSVLLRLGAPPRPTPPAPPAGPPVPTESPPPSPAGAGGLTLLDARPAQARVPRGATLWIAWRLRAEGGGGGKFRLVVSARDAGGAYEEWMQSPPIDVPPPGTTASGTLPVAPPAAARGQVHLRVVARRLGAEASGPQEDDAETDVEIVDAEPAAATAAPVPLAALLPGGVLPRDRGEPAAFLLHYPAARGAGAVLEVSLEAGGRTHPLGEFDLPAGPAELPAVARGRLRAPADAPAGPATLVLTVRGVGGPAAAPLRVPVEVR